MRAVMYTKISTEIKIVTERALYGGNFVTLCFEQMPESKFAALNHRSMLEEWMLFAVAYEFHETEDEAREWHATLVESILKAREERRLS